MSTASATIQPLSPQEIGSNEPNPSPINPYSFRELPFTPSATEEQIQKASEFLCEDTLKAAHGVAVWRIVYDVKDNPVSNNNTGSACHANLTASTKSPRACVALLMAEKVGLAEEQSVFMKWFVEESFFSRFILFHNEYGVVLSTDIPANLFHNICIISRHIREQPLQAFPLFAYLRERIGGDLAYLLVFGAGITYGSLESALSSQPRCAQGAHRAFYLPSLKGLCDFSKGLFARPFHDDPSARKSGGLSGGLKLIHSYGFQSYAKNQISFMTDLTKREDFVEELSSYRKESSKGGAYKPPNPFTSVQTMPPDPKHLSFQEIVDVAIPYLKKTGEIE